MKRVVSALDLSNQSKSSTLPYWWWWLIAAYGARYELYNTIPLICIILKRGWISRLSSISEVRRWAIKVRERWEILIVWRFMTRQLWVASSPQKSKERLIELLIKKSPHSLARKWWYYLTRVLLIEMDGGRKVLIEATGQNGLADLDCSSESRSTVQFSKHELNVITNLFAFVLHDAELLVTNTAVHTYLTDKDLKLQAMANVELKSLPPTYR